MAVVRGQGALSQRECIAIVNENRSFEVNGKKRQYVDVQLNADALEPNSQSNLHLTTRSVENEEGKKSYDHGEVYYDNQIDAMKEAAGDKVVELESGSKVYYFKADLLPSKTGKGIIVNTKSLQASDMTPSPDVIKNQYSFMKATKEAKTKESNKEIAKPQIESEKQDEKQVEQDQPSL